MGKVRKTEITIETERLLVIRRRYRAIEAWCDQCGKEVVLIRSDSAAAVVGKSLRTILSETEAAPLHFVEQLDGLLLICLDSLLNQTGGR